MYIIYNKQFYIGGIIMNKKFLSVAIAALLLSPLAGCGNKQTDTTTEDNKNENVGSVVPDANDNAAVVDQDTNDDNDQNTDNMISLDDLAQGKYMITNEKDGVSLVYNEGSYIMNTYYYFKDGKLQSIDNARAYKDEDSAKKACEALKNDEKAKKEYASIDVEQNVVYMMSNQNAVDTLKSLNQQQLYDKLKSEHPDALTEENMAQNNTKNESENKNEQKTENK